VNWAKSVYRQLNYLLPVTGFRQEVYNDERELCAISQPSLNTVAGDKAAGTDYVIRCA
jgi:hypothetical protein